MAETKPRKQNSNKRFLEDEKTVQNKKNFCNEFESILKKESIIALDKFDLYFNEQDEPELICSIKNSGKKLTSHPEKEVSKNPLPFIEDDYVLLKAMSVNYSEDFHHKTRANSILRVLELNMDEKRKLSSTDA